MGRMEADFHCLGTVDEDSERFIMSANGAARILSNPVDVGLRVSRMLNICHSETC